jgi:translocation and assembly module TamA
VDAGVVTNQTSQVDAQLGVGAGLRYNSPVGPLQLDLAYGVDAKRFRVHLNVGFSF